MLDIKSNISNLYKYIIFTALQGCGIARMWLGTYITTPWGQYLHTEHYIKWKEGVSFHDSKIGTGVVGHYVISSSVDRKG